MVYNKNPSFSFMLSLGIIASNANSQDKSVPINNNQSIFALRSYGPYAQLYQIDLMSGTPIKLTNDAFNIKVYDVSPDGRHLAWIGEDAHGSSILKLGRADASQAQNLIIQHAAPNDLSNLTLPPNAFHFEARSNFLLDLLVSPLEPKPGSAVPAPATRAGYFGRFFTTFG